MPHTATARKFPTELKEIRYEVEEYAAAFGLDFFRVIFKVLDYSDLNEVAAYTGFPYRYPQCARRTKRMSHSTTTTEKKDMR